MDLSIGGLVDAASDVVNSAVDLVGAAGDLAGQAAPIVGLANPAAGAALASFAEGSNLLQQVVQDQVVNQQSDNIRDHRGEAAQGGSGGGGAVGGGGGGSVFEQLAIAMGEAMDKKLQELLDAAKDLSSADSADILSQSAKITALSKELEFISQATNSSINGLGTAAKTAAQKA